ncbi:MAG: hypothetical protein IPH72_01060 [Sandaracinaceae bacterium]|nr:hypothetical protein [Sandaracinaceae bacterium]MBP7681314.1 hypothetical protein [Deltaproteobacteria bacterium]
MPRSPHGRHLRRTVLHRVGAALSTLLALGLGVARGAADEPTAADRLLAVTSADAMDYAAAARRVGDAALAAMLADEAASVELRLAVVRAAPFARAPENLLAPIVELAHGTDPALAPAALTSAFQIAQGLEFSLLEQREADPELLNVPVERLRALGEDDEARADLRQLALHTAARLVALQRDVTE